MISSIVRASHLGGQRVFVRVSQASPKSSAPSTPIRFLFQPNAGLRTASPASLRMIPSILPARHVFRSPMLARGRQMHTATENASAAATKNYKPVGYWLLGTAALVFGMVILGGATRLTRSGLSIVEWKASGEPLPKTDEGWKVEFEKYKNYPEYQRVNSLMTLEEFKFIYFMEWAHRMYGRFIGIAFAGPLVAFAAMKAIPPGFGSRLGLLLGLGAAQGGIGWWMVKSGLVHENFKDHDVPRVSPYRLTTHLGFAWTLYSLLLWNAWDILRKPFQLNAAQSGLVKNIKPFARLYVTLVGITITSGAFVAGNEAGLAYNDWPRYAGRWIPEQIWDPALGIRNFFENTATVQFDHRMLAYTTLASVGGMHMAMKKATKAGVHPAIRRAVMATSGFVGLQALLGIGTLMMYVPVSMGVMHQAGALALWTSALYMLHTLKMAVPDVSAKLANAAANAVKVNPATAAAGALGLLVVGDAIHVKDK